MHTMKCVVAALFSLLSLGQTYDERSCDSLMEPIQVSNQEILGKWMYIGASSVIPGSRSLGRLLDSVWLDITATSQSNTLNIVQTQRVKYGSCWTITYNVTFERSIMLIEQPFYLKEVYLPTICSDCLVAWEDVIVGNDSFTSLLLFSKSRTVSPEALEMFKKQVECSRMPAIVMVDPNTEICPDNLPQSAGLPALQSLFENKMGHRVARLLDAVFDAFSW
ncbi:uncharacterized protein LOC114468498 [Gouania willdenowi]|uniref:uncharacterized protein LOC114468498 n=1 Tax=Gouania willdenowi TaxID=441366 RepID=UPI0010555E67|nr:uncharacterized protein LOC114468498 [Gouania willdenowi]